MIEGLKEIVGDPWTPGANWATTLEINRAVKLEGHALPAGKYSLWFTPAPRPQAWTVELNRTWRRFHVVRPDANEDQLRFTITPDSTALKEMLTFEFPVVTRDRVTGFEIHSKAEDMVLARATRLRR